MLPQDFYRDDFNLMVESSTLFATYPDIVRHTSVRSISSEQESGFWSTDTIASDACSHC